MSVVTPSVQKDRIVPDEYRDGRKNASRRIWRIWALYLGVHFLIFCLVCSISWHS